MKEREKEIEQFMSCGERQTQKGEGSEELADLSNLHATQGHDAIQAELQPMAMSVPMDLPQPWLC